MRVFGKPTLLTAFNRQLSGSSIVDLSVGNGTGCLGSTLIAWSPEAGCVIHLTQLSSPKRVLPECIPGRKVRALKT